MDQKKLQGIGLDLEEHISSSKYGIIVTDFTGEFVPISVNPAKIDSDTLDFLKNNVQQKLGVSDSILNGKYTPEEHIAFYQTCVEPFINQFEQLFTDCLFTTRQKDVGHLIKCYYNNLTYASMEQKIQLTSLATQSPIININEIREMYGLAPVEHGDKFMQDLNHIEQDKASAYQMAKAGANTKKGGDQDNKERTDREENV